MTDLRRLADDLFARYNCFPGDGERNHCLRLYDFAGAHARRAGVEIDEDLVYLAAMLHDLGLMVPRRRGTNYLTRTVELAERELSGAGLDTDAWATLNECLLYNHAVRPAAPLRPMAEAFRRAVFTEHSRGLLRFGLSRREVRATFARHPYANFARVLASFIGKTVALEPWTLAAVFVPRAPAGNAP